MKYRFLTLLFLASTALLLASNPDGMCTIPTPSTSNAIVDSNLSFGFLLTGCDAPLRLADIATGTLPPGLSLAKFDGEVRIVGAPTTAGIYAFSLRIVDAKGHKPSAAMVINVSEQLKVTTPAVANGVSGAAYSQQIHHIGGHGPYTYSIAGGALPTGLTINSSGLISGTMPASGTTFALLVTDAGFATAQKWFTIYPASAQITTAALLSNGDVSSPYSSALTSTLGATGFSIALGTLPPGLTISAGGTISGTPTTAGVYDFTVRQTIGAESVWKSFRMNIRPTATVTGTPRNAELSYAYEHAFTVPGAIEPVSYALTSGTLPAGIVLDPSSGALTGEASALTGATNFTITATDATGKTYTGNFNAITVFAPLEASVASYSPIQVFAFESVQPFTLSSGPGAGPYRYQVIGGDGSAYGFMHPTLGQFSYQFFDPGFFSPYALVTDSLGGSVLDNININVVGDLAFETAAIPNASTDPYSFTIQVTNDDFGPITYSINGGSLPPGLSLNSSTGEITGTITSSGSYTFTVKVADSRPQNVSKSFTMNASGTGFRIVTAALNPAVTGQPVDQTFMTAGTGGTITFDEPGNLLITRGLTLNPSTGQITGVVTGSTPLTFTLRMLDGSLPVDQRVFTLPIGSAVNVTAASQPSGYKATTGVFPTTIGFNITGGTPPYQLKFVESVVPEGLFLRDQGGNHQLRGSPTLAGDYNIGLQAIDADGRNWFGSYNVFVRDPVKFDIDYFAPATVGTSHSYLLEVRDGHLPYAFTVTAGALPPGLALNASTGEITGTPTTAGTYTPTVRVSDSSGVTADTVINYVVTNAISITSPTNLPGGSLQAPYSAAIARTGGEAASSHTISNGSLPPLLEIAPDGTISLVPLRIGTYNFDVTVRDIVGRQATKSHQITIAGGLTITTATLPNGTTGTAYGQTVATANAVGTVTFSVAGGVLPTGLNLNSSSGAITGIPSATGTFSFTIGASDSVISTSQAYTVIISNPLAITTVTLPAATNGVAYSATVATSGGRPAITFSVSAGNLAPGLSLNAGTGEISGTLTSVAAASFNFSIAATDADGRTAAQPYTLNTANPVTITTTSLPSGTLGAPYSQTIVSGGGGAGRTFTVSVGGLPSGLALNASSGAISGTPNAVAVYGFSITATDDAGRFATRAYSVSINAAFVITPATLPNGTSGTAYSQTISSTGGMPAVSYAVTAGALPTGLSLATSGALTGTPTVPALYTFTVTATDGALVTTTQAYTVIISSPLSITTTTLPNGTNGTAYNQTIATAGGRPEVARTLSAGSGALPTGLALAPDGVIAGTPTANGTFNFSVTATDADGRTAVQTYAVIIASPLSITTATLPDPSLNTPYSSTVTTTGGRGTVTFSLGNGAPPTGLTLSTAGLVSGTPTAVGPYSFNVVATDADGRTAEQSYSVTVSAAVTILPATLPSGVFAQTYSATFTATNTTGALTWSVSAGTLPAGLNLNSTTGALTGTPSVSGSTDFTIRVTDSAAQTGTQAYTFVVGPGLIITPSNLPNGTRGTAYSQTFSVTNATGTPVFTVTAGALPDGLTLSSAGVLSGIPDFFGNHNFTVTVTDSVSQTVSQPYTLRILDVLTINPLSLPNGTPGVTYSAALSSPNASGPVAFTVSAGSLPSGLALGSSGILSGSPTTSGGFTFTATATDESLQTGSRAYTVTIGNAMSISPAFLSNGTLNAPYSATLTANNAPGPVVFSIATGTLPTGLTLAANGAISGTPTAPGTFNFEALAQATAASVTHAYSIRIQDVLTVNPVTLPNAIPNLPYTVSLSSPNAAGTATFAVVAGMLPPGLTLSQAGVISGTSTTGGAYDVVIGVTDSVAQSGSRAYIITVGNPLDIQPLTIPSGTAGAVYSATLTTVNNEGAAVFSITSGALPAGITLSSGGVLSGTPATSGVYTFTVFATDAASQPATRTFTLRIFGVLNIAPATLSNGALSAPYSETLIAANATGAVTFGVSAGALPAGLTLTSGGLLSGTPAAAGLFPFTVTATDSLSQSGSRGYTLRINGILSIAPATLPNGIANSPYSQTLTASGATGGVNWSLSSGALPAGLTLAPSTGVLSGTPTAAGAFSFVIVAADSLGALGFQSYALDINATLFIVAPTLPDGFENEVYPATPLTATGGTGSYVWSIATGALPHGLALSPAGVINGTPTDRGTSSFTVRVTDTRSNTATRSLVLTVGEELRIVSLNLGEAVQGRLFTGNLTAAGGRPPYQWIITQGVLPAGITLNTASGLVSGTTTVPEALYPFTVRVTDSRSRGVTSGIVFGVRLPPPPALTLSPSTVPNGVAGQPYAAGFSASGGVPGYSFSLAQGSLPPGLLFAGGQISGTPTTAGTYRFTVNVSDASNRVAGQSYSITIDPAPIPLRLSPATINPAAPIGQLLRLSFSAAGGKAPYSFAFSGQIPSGMSTNSDGLLIGTPNRGGGNTFTVTLTDAAQATASNSYTLTITGNISITTASPLPEGTVAVGYSTGFSAGGGLAPYAWSLSAGAPPPGLTLSGTSGILSGTPSTAGVYNFTVQVRDTQQLVATQAYNVRIYDPLVITNAPAAIPVYGGQSYGFAFTTTGGKAPVAFGLASGGLPPGLSLSSNGEISGTVAGTATGAYTFSVRATDALNNEAVRAGSIQIAPGLTVTTTDLPAATQNQPYSAGLSASGGAPPLGSWGIAQGSLPAGLSLSADGEISGTPTGTTGASFTVLISDANGVTATKALSITVNPPPLPPLPPINVTGFPVTTPPGQQTNITVNLTEPYPVPVNGTITLTFTPATTSVDDDPSVQFSSGGRSVTFAIPAGQTAATFPVDPLRLLTGTVAGTIRISIQTNPAPSTPIPERVVEVPAAPPVIAAGSATLGTGSFTLQLDGYSNTREVSSATFRVNPTPGSTLQASDFTVNVTPAFTTWYAGSPSALFGGQFRFTMPFDVAGAMADIESVTVTLTNRAGTSQPYTVRLR